MVACFRPRQGLNYILPCRDARRRSRRNPHPHGPWRHVGRTFHRLRSNGPRQRLSTFAVSTTTRFRNALIPIITILGLQFGTLLAGTIVTETIFSWPGIGRLTVQAISSRDYPLLQGCILVIALSYVLVNLLTDFLYAVIDPRVRLS